MFNDGVESELDAATALDAHRRRLAESPDDPALNRKVADSLRQLRRYGEARPYYSAAVAGNPRDREAWEGLGIVASREGDLPAARAALEKALGHKWEDAHARAELAHVLHQEGQLEGAVRYATEALESPFICGPERCWVHVTLAHCYWKLGAAEDHLRHAREAVATAPAEPYAQYLLGEAYIVAGEPEQAIIHLRQTVILDPGMVHAWRGLGRAALDAGDLAEARKALERACELRPGDPDPHAELVAVMIRLNDPESVAAAAKQALRLGARDELQAWLHTTLGVALEQLEEPSQAIHHYLAAVELNPADYESRFRLGKLYARESEFGAAVAQLERAALLRPTDPAVLSDLGFAASRAQEHSIAIDALQRAIELDPGNAWAHATLLEVMSHLEDFESAVRHGMAAVRLDPENAGTHYNLAVALMNSEDYAAALGEVRRAMELCPEDGEFKVTAGQIHMELGQWDEAESMLRPILLSELHDRAHPFLVKLCIGRERVDEAMEIARTEIGRHPDSAAAWAVLNLALRAGGRIEEASEALGRAQSLDADDPWVRWVSEEAEESD